MKAVVPGLRISTDGDGLEEPDVSRHDYDVVMNVIRNADRVVVEAIHDMAADRLATMPPVATADDIKGTSEPTQPS
jgi:hypothetical protein